MAAFCPDFCKIAVALACLCATLAAAAQDVPILLDAESTNYDRRNQRLLFEKVSIKRGDLGISADHADSSQLDFADSTWVFTGNVRILSETARVQAATASMEFANHRLRRATIKGSPAVFRNNEGASVEVSATEAVILFAEDELDRITLTGQPATFVHRSGDAVISQTQGHAGQLDYDVGKNRIRLLGKAWVSQGDNEIRGEEISYDIEAQSIIAGGNDSGERVRITITPPAGTGDKLKPDDNTQ